jgi:hypothetical protein
MQTMHLRRLADIERAIGITFDDPDRTDFQAYIGFDPV